MNMSETIVEQIRDGQDIQVVSGGQLETVKVSKVAWHAMGQYASVFGVNEVQEIAFYTGKSESWVKCLDEDGADGIVRLGRALNEAGLGKFLNRQAEVAQRLAGFRRKVESAT